jgi:hypothetical protein
VDLPACDGGLCYRTRTIALTGWPWPCSSLVAPVYSYDLNAAAKNLIETDRLHFYLAGQGGRHRMHRRRDHQLLAPLGFMNSLAIDYRCLVSPRYVSM